MTSEKMAWLTSTLKEYFTSFRLVPTCYVTASKLRNTRVPKLPLCNCSLRCSTSCIHAVAASRDGKLELPVPNSQAGALVVIHKCPGNSSYPPGSGYPVPWMVSLIHPWSLDSGNPCRNDVHFVDLCIKTRAGAWELAQNLAGLGYEL